MDGGNTDLFETHDEGNFAEEILARKSNKEESGYMNCNFFLSTSNVVERFFSLLGNALTEHHQYFWLRSIWRSSSSLKSTSGSGTHKLSILLIINNSIKFSINGP